MGLPQMNSCMRMVSLFGLGSLSWLGWYTHATMLICLPPGAFTLPRVTVSLLPEVSRPLQLFGVCAVPFTLHPITADFRSSSPRLVSVTLTGLFCPPTSFVPANSPNEASSLPSLPA